MALPQLNVHRRDRSTRALITLAGEIDLTTTPLVRIAPAECLRDGIRAVDVDLTAVTFCDGSGLNAFLPRGWQEVGAIRRPAAPAVLRPSDPVLLRALLLPLGPRAAARPDGRRT
ncbi:STAS domain-containing protein, partial [Streptomyces sp. URMC 125]|uniref:STAS domain-containing protein n=1 Tax=Streptomyces sp. URMC 125 TaxID=3423419 RepID=UPI003F1A151C